MENKEIILQDIPRPIGSFILDQTDLPGVKGNDGTYWHYKDVCTMLDRAIKQDMSKYRYAASQPLYSLEQVKEIAEAFAVEVLTATAKRKQVGFNEWSATDLGKALLGKEPVEK